jgi:hypothetical protein
LLGSNDEAGCTPAKRHRSAGKIYTRMEAGVGIFAWRNQQKLLISSRVSRLAMQLSLGLAGNSQLRKTSSQE